MSVPRRGQSGAMRCAELPPLMYDVPCRRLQWKSCLAGVYASDLLSGRRRSGGHGQRPHLTWIRYPKHVARGRCTGARYTPTRTRDAGGATLTQTRARDTCVAKYMAPLARGAQARKTMASRARYTRARTMTASRARNAGHHRRQIHGREIHGIAGARCTGAKCMASRARDTRARNTWHRGRER